MTCAFCSNPSVHAWARLKAATPRMTDLERCDREIADMQSSQVPAPAYLTTLGISDWQCEKRLILREMAEAGGRE